MHFYYWADGLQNTYPRQQKLIQDLVQESWVWPAAQWHCGCYPVYNRTHRLSTIVLIMQKNDTLYLYKLVVTWLKLFEHYVTVLTAVMIN